MHRMVATVCNHPSELVSTRRRLSPLKVGKRPPPNRQTLSSLLQATSTVEDESFLEKHLRAPPRYQPAEDLKGLLEVIGATRAAGETSMYEPISTLLNTLSKRIFGACPLLPSS